MPGELVAEVAPVVLCLDFLLQLEMYNGSKSNPKKASKTNWWSSHDSKVQIFTQR
ncbi:hypothetical protein SLEP1_g41118 [Rubroshorea leprosula]|uniref:Uncharacterized protein n=1 Tax=Rubroshorea leprosula TaxID=152421 RepID=A0AAV5L5J8_9ROSI|nr:hypothetical protein SLEP1_g41118 [Rubroshorea leprosula]